MAYTNYPNVNDIITGVSQDIRQQLSATTSQQQSILIDYTNRIHKQVLRFSRWGFLLSQPQYFLTQFGQSNYWIGPSGAAPTGYVDTVLNLPDMDKIKKDSLIDLSNERLLKWLSQPVIGPTLTDRLGQGRPGQPATWVQDPNNPNQLQLYPPSKNDNTSQPSPQPPYAVVVPGGAQAARTYFVKVTYVDQLGGESTTSTSSYQQFVPASNLIKVKSPKPAFTASVANVMYNQYNVYAALATNTSQTGQFIDTNNETLQNVTPIQVGTDWTEPNTGLTTTGKQPPNINTLQQLGGFVIKFQYYKARTTLTGTQDVLQVPEDYKDVIIHGVNAMAWKLLGKTAEATQSWQLYRSGLTEMVWDKNLFPEGVEFMRPDAGSYVNTQILGFLPPFI